MIVATMEVNSPTLGITLKVEQITTAEIYFSIREPSPYLSLVKRIRGDILSMIVEVAFFKWDHLLRMLSLISYSFLQASSYPSISGTKDPRGICSFCHQRRSNLCLELGCN